MKKYFIPISVGVAALAVYFIYKSKTTPNMPQDVASVPTSECGEDEIKCPNGKGCYNPNANYFMPPCQ